MRVTVTPHRDDARRIGRVPTHIRHEVGTDTTHPCPYRSGRGAARPHGGGWTEAGWTPECRIRGDWPQRDWLREGRVREGGVGAPRPRGRDALAAGMPRTQVVSGSFG